MDSASKIPLTMRMMSNNATKEPKSSKDAIAELVMHEMDHTTSGKSVVHGMNTARVWSFLADTDLLNRAMGHPLSTTTWLQEKEIPKRRVQWNLESGPVVYEEEAFQWDVTGKWYLMDRTLVNNPHIDRVAYLVSLSPCDDIQDTVVEMMSSFKLKTYSAESAKETCEAFSMHRMVSPKLFEELSETKGWNKVAKTPILDVNRITVAQRSLLALQEDSWVVAKLLDHLQHGLEADLVDMQPRRLCRQWERYDSHRSSDDAVVSCFLRAARIGLLEPRWALVCPGCRGAKGGGTKKVSDLPSETHCQDCNISIKSNPKENTQLVFWPGKGLREVSHGRACVGSPTRTPHILARATLKPNEQGRVILDTLDTNHTRFRLYSPKFGVYKTIKYAGVWHLIENDGFVSQGDDGMGVVVCNMTSQRVNVLVETELNPYASALLAREVLSHSGFASLFGSEEWELLSSMIGVWEESFDVMDSTRDAGPDCDGFDLAVVGSGPAGESLALAASRLGAKVALIEKEECFGGPTGLGSKAFREAALKVLSWTRMDDGHPTNDTIQAVFNSHFGTFRDYAVTLVSHELMTRLGRAGVCLIRGKGRLDAPGKLAVSRPSGQDISIEAPKVALAVGSKPAHPPHVPFDHIRVLDAQEISKISKLPKSIAIVGGGIIACEYASIFGALGVETHLINSHPTFLPILDRELCDGLLDSMRRDGVALHESAKIESWSNEQDELVTVSLLTAKQITVDIVLYAQGREGQTDGIVSSDVSLCWAKRGYIQADDLCAGPPNVFAIGDVAGPPGLASSAMDQGRRLAEKLYGKGGLENSHQECPLVLWTIPEVASVGLTREQAADKKLSVCIARALYRELPRGLLSGDLFGWLDLIVDQAEGTVVGVQILGAGASELIHFGANLVSNQAKCHELAWQVFAAVTLHDLFNVAAGRALDELDKMKTPKEQMAR